MTEKINTRLFFQATSYFILALVAKGKLSASSLNPVGNKTFLKRYFYVSGNVWKTFFIGSLCTYELRFLETFEKRLGRTFELRFISF